jgi:hypothetical protein
MYRRMGLLRREDILPSSWSGRGKMTSNSNGNINQYHDGNGILNKSKLDDLSYNNINNPHHHPYNYNTNNNLSKDEDIPLRILNIRNNNIKNKNISFNTNNKINMNLNRKK